MVLALFTLQATFGFLSAPNVVFEKDTSETLSSDNLRSVEFYSVNWPWVQFSTNADKELLASGWTKEDQSVKFRALVYYCKGTQEIRYSRTKESTLANMTIYSSTSKGRSLAEARKSVVLWLDKHAKESGFTTAGEEGDDNTILFPFGVSDHLFYIGGGRNAPFRLYRFEMGRPTPTWFVRLAPRSGRRAELAGTLWRYIANANDSPNSTRKAMVVGDVHEAAQKDMDANISLAHWCGRPDGGVQGGYIDPRGLPHYINSCVIGRDWQPSWAEEMAMVEQH